MSKYSELFDKTPEALKKDAVLRFPGACSENNGIVISCGCAMKAGDYAKKLGATKVAIIADKIIIQLGMLAPITDSLDKQGIEHCQELPFLSQSVFDVVHRATDPIPLIISLPEVHRQSYLGELRAHSKQCRAPHPKHGSRTA